MLPWNICSLSSSFSTTLLGVTWASCLYRKTRFFLSAFWEHKLKHSTLNGLPCCSPAGLCGPSPVVPQCRSPEREDPEIVHESGSQFETFTFKGDTWSSPAELCTFPTPRYFIRVLCVGVSEAHQAKRSRCACYMRISWHLSQEAVKALNNSTEDSCCSAVAVSKYALLLLNNKRQFDAWMESEEKVCICKFKPSQSLFFYHCFVSLGLCPTSPNKAENHMTPCSRLLQHLCSPAAQPEADLHQFTGAKSDRED